VRVFVEIVESAGPGRLSVKVARRGNAGKPARGAFESQVDGAPARKGVSACGSGAMGSDAADIVGVVAIERWVSLKVLASNF